MHPFGCICLAHVIITIHLLIILTKRMYICIDNKTNNMTHAIIILAHGDLDNLKTLIDYFRSQCYVFVHIDKKSNVTKEEIKSISSMKNVTGVYNHMKIHWGGNSILDCELFLLKEALERCDATYFHIISGEDYPIRPLEDFLNSFEVGFPKNFISCVHLPHPLWQDNTFSRFQYFYPYDWGKEERHPKIVRTAIEIQKQIGFKRRIPDSVPHLYGGSQWMSITRDAVTALLRYTKENKGLYRSMFMIFAPDEIYIQTVLCNILDKKLLAMHNMRFIRWKMENGSCPATLSAEHFFLIATCNKLIARKMTANVSDGLKLIVRRYLLSDASKEIMDNGGWRYDGFLQYHFDRNLAGKIYSYIKANGFRDGVDFGCGCGYYVAHLRKQGFPICGYDANTYTPHLSQLLLPTGDKPCGVADLTDDFEDNVKFDIVLCLDVLTHIPEHLQAKALDNLLKICHKSLVVSCDTRCLSETTKNILHEACSKQGFYLCRTSSNFLYDRNDPTVEFFVFEKIYLTF